MNVKQLQKVMLEFIQRLFMNVLKLTIGFGVGYSYARPIVTVTLGTDVLLAIGLLSVLISAVETWQDWEIVPEKKEPANA